MSKNTPPIKEPIYTGNIINRTWVRFFQALSESSQSSSDIEAMQYMEHESDGKISDLEKIAHDTRTMVGMTAVDLNEIKKMKNDLETMIYMGGN